MKNLELYVHIPFCVRKCAYCDFLSFAAQDEETQRTYVEAVVKEIAYYGQRLKDYAISSIYIGGGTPSVLEAERIILLMQSVRDHFTVREDAEISIEINPGTEANPAVMRQKLAAYLSCGINRLSIGLQSAHNGELDLLGRIHTYEQFLQTYQTAREVGFTNINVDLMSGIPYQTPEKFRQSLQRVVRLKPEHISAYSLIVEEGTPYYDRYHEDVLRQEKGEPTKVLPNEDAVCRMMADTNELLGAHGYRRYEISNYALPGYECRHNLGYWERAEYLGVGLGASSLLWNTRYENMKNPGKYIRSAAEIHSIKAIRGVSDMQVISQNSRDARALSQNEKDAQVIPQNVTDTQKISQKAGIMQEKTIGISSEDDAARQKERRHTWKTNLHASEIKLSRHDQMAEFMYLGLRKTDGIARSDFESCFGVSIDAVYPGQIRRLSREGLLVQRAGRIYLTEQGLNVSNYAMAQFLF